MEKQRRQVYSVSKRQFFFYGKFMANQPTVPELRYADRDAGTYFVSDDCGKRQICFLS